MQSHRSRGIIAFSAVCVLAIFSDSMPWAINDPGARASMQVEPRVYLPSVVFSPLSPLLLVGPHGQLHIDRNPVPAGGSVIAYWVLQDVVGIWFDNGDGTGIKPAASSQAIQVSNILDRRTLQLRWQTSGGQLITDTLVVEVIAMGNCSPVSPDWRGSNPNYPFCSNKDFNWGQSDWEYTVFDNGRDGALWLAWNLYGSNINQVWIHFVHDETICGFDRAAQQQVNEQVALSGRYDFNITQFPYGGTYKVYLEITLADGRVVQWGQKKLCIR